MVRCKDLFDVYSGNIYGFRIRQYSDDGEEVLEIADGDKIPDYLAGAEVESFTVDGDSGELIIYI